MIAVGAHRPIGNSFSVKNAASVAGLMITTEAMAELPADEEDGHSHGGVHPPMGDGMGGMGGMEWHDVTCVRSIKIQKVLQTGPFFA